MLKVYPIRVLFAFLFSINIFTTALFAQSMVSPHWRVHRDHLQAGKKMLGLPVVNKDAEIVAQKVVVSLHKERLILITERDRKNNFVKLLARSDGVIVARLEYRFITQSCCYLCNLKAFIVDKGYGSLILTELLSELEQEGYVLVELHSTKAAERFYKKQGFKYVKTIISPDIYPSLQTMSKKLSLFN